MSVCVCREEGGGGITRVLQDGGVWEKAGVNVSVVYGTMPPEAYRAAKGTNVEIPEGAPRVPFFACGISSVMHPKNPHCPTMHFNYRYFETDEWCGIPGQSWFGGGTDITPMYVDKEDLMHFHGTYKDICDKYDESWHPRFKKWADDYFMIPHRGETRGLGGIFYDDLQEKDHDTLINFAADNLQGVIDSYVPIVKKHKDDAFTQQEKDWQQIRRGRYVEFNLVYDRGTIFGLKTGGRIESILMSMPLSSRWEYDVKVKPGSPEHEVTECFKKNPDWANMRSGPGPLLR